jgi:predicted SAM-dependent methyltransferase
MKSPAFMIRSLPYKAPFDGGLLEELAINGLNCGSGFSLQKEPWLNTDLIKISDGNGSATSPGTIAYIKSINDNTDFLYLEHDAREPFPFEDEVFQWIISEHFIEHITPNQAVHWLKECRRMLKPGGIMRISTPDLRLHVKGYLQRKKTFFKQQHKNVTAMLSHLANADETLELIAEEDLIPWLSSANPALPESEFREMVQNSQERQSLITYIQKNSWRPAFMINQVFQLWQHKWIYDFDELKFAAREAGFNPACVKQTTFGKGNICRFDLAYRRYESLYVEIRKE